MTTLTTRSGKGSPLTNTELDSNFTNLNTDKLEVSGGTMTGDLDMDGNKVLFSNMYATLGDLPSATDNHGMFAHVHATGKGYFAHGGNWVALANASDVTSYTHPNHSGEVTSTGDGATVIADNVVDEANLKVSNAPTNGYVLTAQSGNTGGLTWAAAASGGGGADLYAANESSPTAQPSATGTNAIAIGDSAISTGTNSFAFGKARSVGIDSLAANITSTSTSYGAKNNKAIAIGYLASAGTGSVCIGYGSWSGGSHSYAIGESSSNQNYSKTYSFGHSIFASADNQVNIAGAGQDVRISETYTLPKVDGSANQVLTTDGSGAVSWATPASGGGGSPDYYDDNLVGTLFGPNASGDNAIAIGKFATSAGELAVSLGFNASATHEESLALGMNAKAYANKSIAIGSSMASGEDSLALQIANSNASYGASGTHSFAIGELARATSTNSIAIGKQAVSTSANRIVIGGPNDTVEINGAYRLPTSDGTNGQVLTTSGTGALSFTTPSGGGGITTGKAIAMAMVFG